MDVDQVKLRLRREAGRELTALVWRFPGPVRALASGPLGGGVGVRRWVLLAQVSPAVERKEPATYLTRLAVSLGLAGCGVGLVTTGDLRSAVRRAEDGVVVVASVVSSGRSVGKAPASASGDHLQGGRPVHCVDLVVGLPVPVADAELVRTATVVTSAAAGCLGHSDLGRQPGPLHGLCVVCPDGPEAGRRSGDVGWERTAGRVVETLLHAEAHGRIGGTGWPGATRSSAPGQAGLRQRRARPDRRGERSSVPSGSSGPDGEPLRGPADGSPAPAVRPAELGGARKC